MTKSFSIVFLLTIPFCFFCLFFPTEILSIVSGQKYIPAINALRILAGVPFIIGVCNVLGTQFLLPIGQEKKILHATIFGLIISLLLNFLLIPQLKFIGSSIACLAAEATVCLYILFAAKKHIKFNIDYSLVAQILISMALCLLTSFMMKAHLHNLAMLLFAFGAYLLSFVILQFFVFKNAFIYSLIRFKRTF